MKELFHLVSLIKRRCKAGTTTEVKMVAAKARKWGKPHGYGL